MVVERPHPFGFKEDIIIFPYKIPSHFRTIKMIKTLFSIQDVDIFHEHMLTSGVYNILKLRNAKAKRIYHYHSSSNQNEPDPTKGVHHANFVSIPTRLRINKNFIWIPLPVDTETIKITDRLLEKNEIIIGVGSDFSDRTKGKFLRLDLVNKAIENLRNKGYKIRTLEFKGYKHNDVLQYWEKIDIWIDRFQLGFYGFTTIEAASCGIPILCEIDEDMEQYIPKCPFLRTKPIVDNIESNLEYLLSESNREHFGKKCRDYVIQKHDIVKVAQKCLEEYKKILA